MPENQASTLELLITLARGDGSLQRQIEDQLRAAIRTGRVVEGDRLPASRALAGDLGVSRGVVSDAYTQLAAEGWIEVAPRASPRVSGLAMAPGRIVSGCAPSSIAVRYDLRPGRPDLSRFPRGDWVRSLSAAVRGAGVAGLAYPPIAGGGGGGAT